MVFPQEKPASVEALAPPAPAMPQSALANRPLFSIITPSLNQLEWLRLCVASVRDQLAAIQKRNPLLTVEHIIQDAGSPGIEEFALKTGAALFRNGRQILDPPSAEPGRNNAYTLTIHCEPDCGMYDAVNKGLRRAAGKFCAFINSDEQYLPGTLLRVAHEFETRPQADLLFGDAILLDSECRPVSYRQAIRPYRPHLRLCHLSLLTCSVFFRRELIERSLLFDPNWKIIGDAVWMDSLLAAGVRMERIPAPLSLFAWTPENLSEKDLARGSQREQEKWIQEGPAPPRWARLALIILHRVRKLLSGAYRSRLVEIACYAQDSPGQRRTSGLVRLPTGWPGQTLALKSFAQRSSASFPQQSH